MSKSNKNISKTVIQRLAQVGYQLSQSSTPEQQSIFLELMEELLNPVRPFMTDEEAAFYHQKIDCMFPASGVLGNKGRLKKMRYKISQNQEVVRLNHLMGSTLLIRPS